MGSCPDTDIDLLDLPYANWGVDFNTCTLQDGLTYNTSRNFAGYVEIFPTKIIEMCKISASKMAACIICWLSHMFCSPKKKPKEPRISVLKIPWINQCGLFFSLFYNRVTSHILHVQLPWSRKWRKNRIIKWILFLHVVVTTSRDYCSFSHSEITCSWDSLTRELKNDSILYVHFFYEMFTKLTYRTFGQNYLAGSLADPILFLRNPWWLVVSCVPDKSKTFSMAIVNRISGA